MIVLLIQLYVCLGVIIVSWNYPAIQAHCDFHFNNELESKPHVYANLSVKYIDLIRRLLPITVVISWPFFIRLLINKKK